MNNSIKFFTTYFTGMGIYGYYRGYNNLYNIKTFNTKEILVVDQIIKGLHGMVWQMNPIIQPFILYGIAKRYEKQYRNIPITQEDFEY
jgi:hypothetical protein